MSLILVIDMLVYGKDPHNRGEFFCRPGQFRVCKVNALAVFPEPLIGFFAGDFVTICQFLNVVR